MSEAVTVPCLIEVAKAGWPRRLAGRTALQLRSVPTLYRWLPASAHHQQTGELSRMYSVKSATETA